MLIALKVQIHTVRNEARLNRVLVTMTGSSSSLLIQRNECR